MKKITILSAAAVMILSAATIISCKKTSGSSAAPTLYDSLGGTTLVADPTAAAGVKIEQGRLGIRSVLDSTIFVIAADSRINGHFTVLLGEVSATPANFTGFNALSKNLTDFVCVATGAKDFTYGGKNMVAAHDPAQNSRMNGKATDADFDAFVDDLVTGAHKNNLPTNLIGSVGTLVESLRSQVVQQATPAP